MQPSTQSPRPSHVPVPHEVPADTKRSVGHAAAVPLQSSATSHAPVASRHSVVSGANVSGGQVSLVPSHVSALSHGPAAGRHSVPAGCPAHGRRSSQLPAKQIPSQHISPLAQRDVVSQMLPLQTASSHGPPTHVVASHIEYWQSFTGSHMPSGPAVHPVSSGVCVQTLSSHASTVQSTESSHSVASVHSSETQRSPMHTSPSPHGGKHPPPASPGSASLASMPPPSLGPWPSGQQRWSMHVWPAGHSLSS